MIWNFSYRGFHLGLFRYWIGLSRRNVKGLGKVLDLGFLKVVW